MKFSNRTKLKTNVLNIRLVHERSAFLSKKSHSAKKESFNTTFVHSSLSYYAVEHGFGTFLGYTLTRTAYLNTMTRTAYLTTLIQLKALS